MGPFTNQLSVLFSILWLLPFIFIVACAPKVESTKVRWSRQQGQDISQAIPSALYPEIKKAHENGKVIELSDKRIVRTQQKVGNIEIEGTWYQAVQNRQGEFDSLTLQWINDLPDVVLIQAAALEEDKDDLLAQAITKSSLLAEAKELSPPKVILRREIWNWSPYIKVIVTPKDESDVLAVYLNSVGHVRSYRSVAHHVDGVGMVFTGSPESSHLSEEVLHDLVGDGTLSSRALKVHSGINTKPFNERHVFRYTPDQKAFDNVQVFFFVDQTVHWFKEQLSLTLPFVLDVKIHIGGVRPTNAAFYYDGNIRLGEGDGRVYKGIPRDPSIVCHEASHPYVELLSGLGFEGEQGSYSEAFSDFFTAVHLGSPQMGQYAYVKGSYKRTLANDNKAFKDFNGGKYNDSLVVSGTFWDLRNVLGDKKSLHLAREFLIRLGPGGLLAELPEVLEVVAAENLSPEDVLKVNEVLQKRGWISAPLTR